jgi:O-antigen ligase
MPSTDSKKVLQILFFSFFLSFMTIRGATGNVALLIFLISMFVLARNWHAFLNFSKNVEVKFLVGILLTPFLAVFFAQLIRLDMSTTHLDAPSRFVLVIPIMFSFYLYRIQAARLITLAIPVALPVMALFAYFQQDGNYSARWTVSYLDPIIWGNFSMILGFMCLYGVDPAIDSAKRILYCLMGFAVGVAMSIMSQSRAGWVAACLLLSLWLFLNRKKISKITFIVLFGLCLGAVYLGYQHISIVQMRVDSAVSEIMGWLSGEEIETSTGYRLTMWKISGYLFGLRPLVGYGEESLLEYLSTPYILSFADANSIYTLTCCGPHNEILAHMIRSGIFGLAFIFGVYIMPALYFFHRIKSNRETDLRSERIGIALCLGCFVCSFFSEMIGLKSTATFYAVCLAVLFANSLNERAEKNGIIRG